MAGARAFAVLSAENNPLFIQVGDGEDEAEVEFAMYASLDDLCERLDEHTEAKARESFLGEVCTVADLTIFAYVLNSGVKLLLAVEEQFARPEAAREVFAGLVGAYVRARANPFADVGTQLSSKAFADQVAATLKQRR